MLEKIAEIYNNLASTGDHPNEIDHGILRALQKPGKAKGPPSNLRPIVLLSTYTKNPSNVLNEQNRKPSRRCNPTIPGSISS